VDEFINGAGTFLSDLAGGVVGILQARADANNQTIRLEREAAQARQNAELGSTNFRTVALLIAGVVAVWALTR
jgi:hypothetical protein